MQNEVKEKLEQLDCDPIRILAWIATGDVISLGLMTQEELEAEAEHDTDDNVIVPDGGSRAQQLIPIRERQAAAKELASYLYAKPKSEVEPIEAKDAVQFYLPDNSRDQKKISIRDVEIID